MEKRNNGIGLREYFEKIIDLRFKATEDALELSREVLGKDLHRMNELRQGYENERQHFVRSERYEPEHKILADKISDVERSITILEARHDVKNRNMWVALAISILVSLITLVKEFVK